MARTFAGHVDVIGAASWMPWVVWAFWRLGSEQNFIGSPHLFVIASAVFAFQLLSGYQTMAFFTVIAVLIMALLYSVQVKSFIPLFRVILAGAFGVALAAIQILPAAEFLGRVSGHFNFPTAGIRMDRLSGEVYCNLSTRFNLVISIRILVRLLILLSIVHLWE